MRQVCCFFNLASSLPPPNMSKVIQVMFEETQQKDATRPRAVLVLDVSDSMKDYNRLKTLKEAVDGFLLCLLDNVLELAIVTFSSAAEVLNSTHTPGGTIVLLTDGVENVAPYIDDVMPELFAANVELVTMAMGDKVEDKLEKLAAENKGKTYFFPDRTESTSRAYIESANSVAHESINHRSGLTTRCETAKGNASEPMDTTASDNSEFTPQIVTFKANIEMLHLEVTSKLDNLADIFQSASTECFHDPGYDSNVRMQMAFGDALGLDIRDTLKPIYPGTWVLRVVTTTKKRIVINMLVMSQVRHLNSKPIVTLCEVSEQEFSDPHDAVIFVDVSKGDNVVLDASVMAMVINTQGLRCPIRLRDDGHDPDIMKHDGTYSGYFTQFTGQGRYSVMAYVDGDQKTRHAYRRPGFPPDAIVWDGNRHRVPSNEVPIRPAPANYIFKDTLLGDLEPTQPFQRVTGGASFKVTRDLRQTDVPPGSIMDLRAVEGHVEVDGTPIVRLTWTWPGAHMTHGIAAAVEIRGGTNRDDLESHFDRHEVISNVVKGNLDPLYAGSKHDVTIALPRNWVTTTYDHGEFNLKAYLAARVINADGLMSEPSRKVIAEFDITNFAANLRTTAADITTGEKHHTQPGPAATNTAEGEDSSKIEEPSVTAEEEDLRKNEEPSVTAEEEDQSKNDELSVLVCILLALVAGVVLMSIIILLLLVKSRSIAENDSVIKEM
ncbi:hypothetical protein HPB49_010207 [Dermacentor silvarum]|uniref:Uncharacterized protein n=1 Tax=Dermacentor silvarum TaxID=543639 RepID=A0ACB8DP23_DERSI|nr:hypothetical protein HPB49_010207 [Dermacentor silvarum]